MKNCPLIAVALAAAGLFLAGCKPPVHTGAVQETVVFGPEFSLKHGLHVPDDTRQSLGLKLVEVSEQPVVGGLDLQMRVIRSDQQSNLAIGTVTAAEALWLKPGQAAQVQLGERSVPATIKSMQQTAEDPAGLLEILLEIPHGSEALSVGAFVAAHVVLHSTGDVPAVPRTALLECTEGRFVYTVSGDHFIRTRVKVGIVGPEWVEISDGLYPGDQVVSAPVMSLWMTEIAALKGGQACCIMSPGDK